MVQQVFYFKFLFFLAASGLASFSAAIFCEAASI